MVEPTSPRVLRVDLDELERDRRARVEPWAATDPVLAPVLGRIGGWSGSALGLALLVEWFRAAPPGGPAPLVVSVGECVRRGLPTAARATVASRAPLGGLLSEGQVGGALGPRLASLCDALLVCGRTSRAGAVLHLAADGAVGLEAFPELLGLDPVATARAVGERLGPCALLSIGPAGEAGVAIASLAAGGEQPSFVGRGGLGAVLGGTGLKAIAVCAPEVATARDRTAEGLRETLGASPRLSARAGGGTFELYHALAARGDLAPQAGDRLLDEAAAAARGRRGCRGCPTPCGWTFARPGEDGPPRAARFSATHPLGPALGLERLEDALLLLAACDRVGVDAKEVGAAMALLLEARDRGLAPGRAVRGDARALGGWIEDIPGRRGDGGRIALGVVGLARRLGLGAEVVASRGQAARREGGLAGILGQCVTSNGADPMRSFPFLPEAGGRGRLEALLGGLPLCEGIDDPVSPAGKGRIVWWHENLVAAVDVAGFCAFSAAGLLADDLCDLDGLARWILPASLRGGEDPPGRRLLALGASVVLLRRELNRALGARPDQDRPPWARPMIDEPGMLDEYRGLRGIDAAGAPTEEALARLATTAVLDVGPALLGPEPATPPAAIVASAPGRVRLRAAGPLRRRLGGVGEVELPLPAPVVEVLRRLGDGRADLVGLLLRGGEPLPAVYRGGRRLAAGDAVEAGDTIDLVLAIAGG